MPDGASKSIDSASKPSSPRLGAWVVDHGTQFALWSDRAEQVCVVLFDPDGTIIWQEPMFAIAGDPDLFCASASQARSGSLYKFMLDGVLVGDPYARCLPFGPNGPAQVPAKLRARRHPKRQIDFATGEVIYELHVGTFTPEGTFASAAERLKHVRELGATVLEVMPLATFPGAHGWGYDGVGLFAPFRGYGTPEELNAFIDAAHGCGLAVVLDVVFNHLGPDGNHLPAYSEQYFHATRTNSWGAAPELEAPPFRNLVVSCARHWLEEYGFDGLRLDATHELEPGGAPHIVREIAAIAAEQSPPAVLIAEDNRNDPGALFAMGVDAVWSDDFHHSLHVLLTREKSGYYAAYEGTLAELARTIERCQLHEGQPYGLAQQRRGQSAFGVERHRLIYALQNHDQVGNRALGERLDGLVDPRLARAAALLLLFLPASPMLFMGQEWAASTPFLYFTDHVEPLGSEVTQGRLAEFAHFADSGLAMPDPQAPATFERCKLSWEELALPKHAQVYQLYREALKLRREDEVLLNGEVSVGVEGSLLWILRSSARGRRLLVLNLGDAVEAENVAQFSAAHCRLLLSSDLEHRHAEAFRLPQFSSSVFALEPSPGT
jgi:maltooligosyltrehalose trehalohydrolase